MARRKVKKVRIYDDLKQSLEEAVAFERGEIIDLRVSEAPRSPKKMTPAEIRKVRESLNASQTIFASFLCVSTKAVQAWEQGLRRPQRTALRLLAIAKSNPAILLND
ncbi:MAG TPA: hypothetical protein VGD60_18690 [Candidatus Acidoferrales bacterium]